MAAAYMMRQAREVVCVDLLDHDASPRRRPTRPASPTAPRRRRPRRPRARSSRRRPARGRAVHASGRCSRSAPGEDVPGLVARDVVGEPVGVRARADEQEQRAGVDGPLGRRCRRRGARGGRAVPRPPPPTTSVRNCTSTCGAASISSRRYCDIDARERRAAHEDASPAPRGARGTARPARRSCHRRRRRRACPRTPAPRRPTSRRTRPSPTSASISGTPRRRYATPVASTTRAAGDLGAVGDGDHVAVAARCSSPSTSCISRKPAPNTHACWYARCASSAPLTPREKPR